MCQKTASCIGLGPATTLVVGTTPASTVSTVGDPRARDQVVMTWAREHDHVVFTHDLDFGALLALVRANGPGIIHVRSHDVLPERLEEIVVATIRTCESQVQEGAIVTVDGSRGRVRILPILS